MKESIPHKKLMDRIVFGAVLPSVVTAIAISHFTLLPFDQSVVIAAGLAALTWFSWRKFVRKRRMKNSSKFPEAQ